MARAKTNRLYRTFVKGLITEASPLTYPEDATISEDNCEIFRKGNRSRRLGVGYESENARLSSYSVPAASIGQRATRTYRWESAAQKGNINFLVHRIGSALYFYDMAFDTLSAGLKPFSVDLSVFQAENSTNFASSEISMVGGKGYLFVVGSSINPFLVEYNPQTDTISTQRIYVQIRDFKGVDDGLANDEEPTTLSNAHKYNLMNQGWVDPRNSGSGGTVTYFDNFGGVSTYAGPTTAVINSYFTQFSRYPGNNKQWWVSRNSTTGDFDPGLLGKFFSGSARAPRGHFIVDAFFIDRSAVSGVTGIPVEAETERPNTVSFFAGRVWYALNSTVYFSQVLDDKGKAGFCYQEADPTSEDISDLIDSDGGVIPIPEMARAVKLMPLGGGIVVFATNGIWYISGTQAGFTATDITVNKVNAIGTDSPDSIVEAEGQIFWWSRVGIMGMSQKSGMFGTVEGVFERTNTTEQTIQSFYNAIPQENRVHVKGAYDPATNKIQWLYRDADTPSVYFYNKILNMDLSLGAYYPWSVNTVGPYLTDIFITPRINAVDSDSSIRSSFIKYAVAVPTPSGYQYTFGLFNNSNFADWQEYDSTGVPYLSFIETGYELLEDAMRDKQTQYVFCYFRRTEETYLPDGPDWSTDKPSSCFLQVKWDWASSNRSGKWSPKVQAYRHVRLPQFEDTDPTFDTGFPVVVTKNKVRGWGRAMQFRFESNEIGKNFDLLGWAVPVSGNTEA